MRVSVCVWEFFFKNGFVYDLIYLMILKIEVKENYAKKRILEEGQYFFTTPYIPTYSPPQLNHGYSFTFIEEITVFLNPIKT